MEPSEYIESLERRLARLEEEQHRLEWLIETNTDWEEKVWEDRYKEGQG